MTVIRIFGKLLMSLGLGVLLFVAWVIWGTNLETAREQERLSLEFDNLQPFEFDKGEAGVPPKGYAPRPGEPIFRLLIPKLELNDGKGYIVVEGVDEESLKLGPGHYPKCRPDFAKPLCTEFPAAWPGTKGRVILSGHRTTYKAPFLDLDKLRNGDEIFVETRWGKFTYEVYEQRVVAPTDPAIIVQKDNVRELVLTTCNPKFSASQRLILFARQVEAEAA
jgi:sortase A